MAFTDPIAINDNAAALQTFTRTSLLPNGSDWVENDSTMAMIRTLRIRHMNAGKSPNIKGGYIRSHLFGVGLDKLNSTLAIREIASMNMTLRHDPNCTITAAELYDALAFQENFWSPTNLDKLLRNES